MSVYCVWALIDVHGAYMFYGYDLAGRAVDCFVDDAETATLEDMLAVPSVSCAMRLIDWR